MSASPSPFDASAPALGYLYQCRYALLLALEKEEDPNLCVSVEKLDDVAFHEAPTTPSVARELLQFKHHVGRKGGLGDSSPDVWKTIRIWAEGVRVGRIDLDRVVLMLVTNSQANNRNAIRFLRHESATRKPSEALKKLVAAGTSSHNQVVNDGCSALMALTAAERESLFRAVYLLDNAPSAVDLDRALGNALRLAVHPQHRDAFVQRLEGWWLRKLVLHLSNPSPSVIPVSDIHQQIYEFQQDFRRSALPNDMLEEDLPPEAHPDSDERTFVRQLHLICLSGERLRYAQGDHYRAFTQRSRWVKDRLIALDEASHYERRLIEGWRERFAIMKEGVPAGGDETTLARNGQELYNWVATQAPSESALWVRPDFRETYMTRGSYHMLADQLRVGWHPEFDRRLKP
jgi:hypothetical protein